MLPFVLPLTYTGDVTYNSAPARKCVACASNEEVKQTDVCWLFVS